MYFFHFPFSGKFIVSIHMCFGINDFLLAWSFQFLYIYICCHSLKHVKHLLGQKSQKPILSLHATGMAIITWFLFSLCTNTSVCVWWLFRYKMVRKGQKQFRPYMYGLRLTNLGKGSYLNFIKWTFWFSTSWRPYIYGIRS